MRTWLRDKLSSPDPFTAEHEELFHEIRQAHKHWLDAQNHLDWIDGCSEEIDYAIFAMAAAEKKYDVLLKRAKQLNWNHVSFYT